MFGALGGVIDGREGDFGAKAVVKPAADRSAAGAAGLRVGHRPSSAYTRLILCGVYTGTMDKKAKMPRAKCGMCGKMTEKNLAGVAYCSPCWVKIRSRFGPSAPEGGAP